MKIIWFGHRDIEHPHAGGAERTIHEVGKRLAAKHHEFHLFTAGWEGAKPYEEMAGIFIHRLGRRLLPHLTSPLFLRENRDADAIIDDLAHAAPWFSPWFSSSPGAVFFHHLHARTLKGQTSIWLAYLLAKLERAYPLIYRTWPFVTESVSSERDLQALGIKPNRITKIPPGVDVKRFQVTTKSQEPQLIYFGGMRRYKRPDHVLYAMRLLRNRGIKARLVIVGEGPALPFMRALCQSLGLYDDVVFTGRLTEDRLPEVVGASWVNLHCSLSEGWCFSAMEASAAGTPTVGYAVPGLTESVHDGNTGVLVRDGDIPALSLALENVLQNHEDWTNRCRASAESYSWEESADKWETYLKGLRELV